MFGVLALCQYPLREPASLSASSWLRPRRRKFLYRVRTRFHFFQNTIRMRLRSQALMAFSQPAISASLKYCIQPRTKHFRRAIYSCRLFTLRRDVSSLSRDLHFSLLFAWTVVRHPVLLR